MFSAGLKVGFWFKWPAGHQLQKSGGQAQILNNVTQIITKATIPNNTPNTMSKVVAENNWGSLYTTPESENITSN
jgi:hypothetical protein